MRDEFVFYLISVTEQVSQRRIELKAPTTKATYLSIPINIYVYPEIIPIGMSVSVFFLCVCMYIFCSLCNVVVNCIPIILTLLSTYFPKHHLPFLRFGLLSAWCMDNIQKMILCRNNFKPTGIYFLKVFI